MGAAVTGFVEGEDGFSIFMQAIPYNFYALLTIVMMIGIVLLKADYGPMRTHEMNALKGDLYTTEGRPYENASEGVVNHNGKVIDLVIPILSLIVCCVIGMIYTGGFFDGVGFVEAFSNSDASVGLVLGSFFRTNHNDCIVCGTQSIEFLGLYVMYSGRIQGDGASNHDPDICVDIKSDDRQSWSSRICCNDSRAVRRGIDELSAGDHFLDWMLPCICDRDIMGNFWYFNPNRSCDFCKYEP